MYGLTPDEMADIDANVDRDEAGLTGLERRLLLNAARAGNTAAVRFLEHAFRDMGSSRSTARRHIAELRAMGPVPEPLDTRAYTDLMNFLKGLQ